MFTKEIVTDGRTARFTITRDVQGWEVREEHDSAVVKHAHYGDWHRVERAMQSFEARAASPESPGNLPR